MYGSKSSRSGVYGESSHSKHSTYCRLSSRFRSRAGRNFAKSFVARASIHTWLPSADARVSLDAQLGRNAALLLPVAPCDADQAGVVGVVLERLFDGAQALEQSADLVVDELLVYDAADRREGFRTSGMAAGRHRHLLIPREHEERAGEVGDLGEALPERTKVGVHRGGLYRRR